MISLSPLTESTAKFWFFHFRITITDTDQKTVSKEVQNDAKEVQDVIEVQDAPVRPYKRHTSPQQKFKDVESLPPQPVSAPLTPDSGKKFWPPSPKLRSATSMVNLTDLDTTEMNNNEQQRAKKSKWYNKLSHTLKLSPQSLKLSGSESNLSKEKTKTKKTIWRRIKLASHSWWLVNANLFVCFYNNLFRRSWTSRMFLCRFVFVISMAEL